MLGYQPALQVMNPTEADFCACNDTRARENLLEKKLLKLGVRGEPMFSELSYFKCAPQLQQTHATD